MKKILFCILCLTVTACTNAIKNENGSENLMHLTAEPTNCVFLYKISSDASVYSAEDAQRYMENQIAKQPAGGNAYFIINSEKEQNSWVMFGPEHKYLMTAKVYDCPNL